MVILGVVAIWGHTPHIGGGDTPILGDLIVGDLIVKQTPLKEYV